MTSITDSIRQQLAELDTERERLLAALAVLEGETLAEASASPQTARRRPQRVAKANGVKVVPLAKLVKTITAEPGLSTTTLAKQLNGDQSQLLTLLKEAEAEGKLTRTGERRGTRWHLTNLS
jgi:hypothetical protein